MEDSSKKIERKANIITATTQLTQLFRRNTKFRYCNLQHSVCHTHNNREAMPPLHLFCAFKITRSLHSQRDENCTFAVFLETVKSTQCHCAAAVMLMFLFLSWYSFWTKVQKIAREIVTAIIINRNVNVSEPTRGPREWKIYFTSRKFCIDNDVGDTRTLNCSNLFRRFWHFIVIIHNKKNCFDVVPWATGLYSRWFIQTLCVYLSFSLSVCLKWICWSLTH